MTTGFSGTYAFNAIDFSLPPTTGKWVPRPEYGLDGGGHSILPRDRDFELSWELISQEDLVSFINFYNAVGNTGTIVADLPGWGINGYQFVRYSGCVLAEPELEDYFQGYSTSVRLLVRHIVVI